ncbi:hypothetical protein MVEN_02281700 [Mycena venus]|uniref:Uncharacterized protein n=1 Tax=Mycena venus TaxID=2733690 RepID=A0A8H6X5H7_9AGAR|nr:hypothetical protein MVEN_02281700 [Mycena venus]
MQAALKTFFVTLQTQIDGVEKAIVNAKQTIAVSGAPPDAVSLLRLLEATHGRLNQQAEELYTSLNIGGSFPELADLPQPFVHTLLILNDLKTVIQRHAIASFQEWEALDRAVVGQRESLDTKLYQATCNAISKLWLDEELSIVDNTLASHSDTTLMLPLQERQQLLNHLKHRWAQQLQPQHLPSGLPLGFHPAEVLHHPTETPSVPPPQSHTFSIAAIPSVRDSALKPDAQMLDVDGDLDDPGFTNVPTESRHIAEDGALYPGSINDPEDAADLIGDDGKGEDGEGKAEETSGLNIDDHFEIRWDSKYGCNLDWSLLQDLHIQNASWIILYEQFSHFVVCGGGKGVMASLYIIFSGSYSPYVVAATCCAVLSTYDLTQAQQSIGPSQRGSSRFTDQQSNIGFVLW